MKKIAFGIGTALVLCSLTAVAAPPDNGSAAARQNEEKQILNDPAFQYPYAAHSAGIELCPGIRSGASLRWFVRSAKKSNDSQVTIRDVQEDFAELSRRDFRDIAAFKFALDPRPNAAGKKRGGLISVWKVEKDNPKQLQQVIDRYMKAYPGLMHSRTSRDESKKFTDDDGTTYEIKNILYMDKLESEKMEIVIKSRDIGVKTSGRRSSQELQFLANSMLMSLAPKMAIQVTITDKVLAQYFASLRDGAAK